MPDRSPAAQAEKRLALWIRACEALAGELSPDEVLGRLAEVAVALIADGCWVELVSGADTLRRAVVAPCFAGAVGARTGADEGLLLPLAEAPLASALIDSGESVLVTDLDAPGSPKLPELPPNLELPGRALFHVGAILRRGSRTVGMLSLLYSEPGPRPGPFEIAAADDLARLGERALIAAQRTQHRRRLQEAAGEMSKTLSRAEVRAVPADHVRVASDADGVLLMLVDGSKPQLNLVASAGYPPDLVARTRVQPLDGATLLAEAVRTEGSLSFSSSVERLRRWSGLGSEAPARQWEAYACFPLAWGGATTGVVSFGFRRPRALDPEDMAHLYELAGHCASALQRAGRFEAERAAVARLRVLAATGQIINESYGMQENLDRITALLASTFGDLCCIQLVAEQTGQPGVEPNDGISAGPVRPGGGLLKLATLAHRDPEREKALRSASKDFPATVADRQVGAGVAIRENLTVIFSEVTDEMLVAAAGSGESLAVLRSLGLPAMSGFAVPLRRASGAAYGALSVMWE